jgi:hypothetical protein
LRTTAEHDRIIALPKPLVLQVDFVLKFIEKDESYKRHFFKRIDNPVWFDVLKKKGVCQSKV